MITTPQKLSCFFFILTLLPLSYIPSAQAGFEWVAPPASKTAPVQTVDRAELAPQPGVKTQEEIMMPTPFPSPAATTTLRRTPPASLSYPDEAQQFKPAAPTSIVTVPAPVASTPIVENPVFSRSVSTPEGPVMYTPLPETSEQSLPKYREQPQVVYPPRGNVPARPLGAMRASSVPVIPITSPVISIPIERAEPLIPTTPIMPIQVTSQPMPINPATAAPAATVRIIDSSAQTIAPTTSPMLAPRAMLDGFGTNIPLSLALEQIVPSGWQVENQMRLDPNMMVSWAGGRPWNKVLEDMLYAHGARITLTGNTVILYRAAAGMPVMSSKPQVAPQMSVASPDILPPVMPPPTISLQERIVDEVAVQPVSPTMPPLADAMIRPMNQMPDQNAVSFDPGKIDLFSGRTGETIETVLNRWGRLANVQILWNVGSDITLPQSFAVNAPFPRAVERLLNIYRDDPVRPIADLETNPQTGGMAVLRVTRAR